ncbi:MAG: HAD-IIA family hydrolase [Magnetococcales bacterium]|nr:HAD-IIA family hydrolase [Magnetococcales bacterium]MBF0149253.1 HAD-IIA family hydrolase [Magnetococcales bacterium]MBF0632425.1 HAD-IIA family hydrolase [Magnetococcales bacterium]
MNKPPIPELEILERHIARYRQMICQGGAGVDHGLRQGRMERVNFSDIVNHYSWIWFDAYGVLNRGPEPVPGAGNTLARLRAAGIPFRLVSNNASHSQEEIQSNLGRMGIEVRREEVVTSGSVIKEFVREHHLEEQPYVWVGALSSARYYAPDPLRWMVNHPQSRWRPDDAHYALFSGNQEYYGGPQERILRASMEQRRLPLLLVNADLVAPEPLGGVNLVAGFTACEVNAAEGCPMLGVGKPFAPVFERAWRQCGCPPWHRVLMVGDALETDILGASALGMATCLTLTGLYGPREMRLVDVCNRLGIRPDFVVGGIAWNH